eukprot:TRINITY_DN7857_c0_g1_i1.p1 TRINITY_DN7857_c0_g1~~TRINITY_DN7857_c0_g1_i1.p1  ORF type:complete len:628 (-),score=121.13 TRINITY_DN7857_c0_g1_i1:212-2095(-)
MCIRDRYQRRVHGIYTRLLAIHLDRTLSSEKEQEMLTSLVSNSNKTAGGSSKDFLNALTDDAEELLMRAAKRTMHTESHGGSSKLNGVPAKTSSTPKKEEPAPQLSNAGKKFFEKVLKIKPSEMKEKSTSHKSSAAPRKPAPPKVSKPSQSKPSSSKPESRPSPSSTKPSSAVVRKVESKNDSKSVKILRELNEKLFQEDGFLDDKNLKKMMESAAIAKREEREREIARAKLASDDEDAARRAVIRKKSAPPPEKRKTEYDPVQQSLKAKQITSGPKTSSSASTGAPSSRSGASERERERDRDRDRERAPAPRPRPEDDRRPPLREPPRPSKSVEISKPRPSSSREEEEKPKKKTTILTDASFKKDGKSRPIKLDLPPPSSSKSSGSTQKSTTPNGRPVSSGGIRDERGSSSKGPAPPSRGSGASSLSGLNGKKPLPPSSQRPGESKGYVPQRAGAVGMGRDMRTPPPMMPRPKGVNHIFGGNVNMLGKRGRMDPYSRRREYDDEEDDYDHDDGFIDDSGDAEMEEFNWKKEIRGLANRFRHNYYDGYDEEYSDEAMEAGYEDVLEEETFSRKVGKMEDERELEYIKREKKMERKKKRIQISGQEDSWGFFTCLCYCEIFVIMILGC